MNKRSELRRGLVGRWESADPCETFVEYRISISKEHYKVSARDTNDGERAEVYDVKWDADHIDFKVHWPSTGRFLRLKAFLMEKGKIGLYYTYSAQGIWVKKLPSKRKKGKA